MKKGWHPPVPHSVGLRLKKDTGTYKHKGSGSGACAGAGDYCWVKTSKRPDARPNWMLRSEAIAKGLATFILE